MHTSGIEIVLTSYEGIQMEHNIRLKFNIFYNKVEFGALITKFQITLVPKLKHIQVYNNCHLIINMILGDYSTTKANLVRYLDMVIP